MDQLKTKMQGNDESQREKQMEEPVAIPQQVTLDVGKKADVMKELRSMKSVMDPSTSKEYVVSIMRKKQKVAQYDIETNILYLRAMDRMKSAQFSLEKHNNSTDSKKYIRETIEIMKDLGQMLRLRNSTRKELDESMMYHITNLTKKKDANINIIGGVNSTIRNLCDSNVELSMNTLLHQIKQTKRHEEREEKKRKNVLFLEDEKLLQKKKKIIQSEVAKSFMGKEESGTVQQKQGVPESLQQRYIIPQRSQVHSFQGTTVNERQLCGEYSHGFLGQLETMQQLVQQLRSHLLVREDNQETINKNRSTESVMELLKLMKDQAKKVKKQQQKQQFQFLFSR